MKKWMTILASLLLLSGCGAKEDTFSLSAAEQEAYEESIDKVTEDFYWEYGGLSSGNRRPFSSISCFHTARANKPLFLQRIPH